MDAYFVIAVLCILDMGIGLAVATRNGERWGIIVFLLSFFIFMSLFFVWMLENRFLMSLTLSYTHSWEMGVSLGKCKSSYL